MSSDLAAEVPSISATPEISIDRHRHSLLASAIGSVMGEHTFGKEIKGGIKTELEQVVAENERYQDPSVEEHLSKVTSKLLRFRPRMLGAILTYSQLTGQSYDSLMDQGGLDSFYMFWALGSIQDDFIDEIPKPSQDEADVAKSKALIGKAIFGDNRRLYRAAYRQLNHHIDASNFGEGQTHYIRGKVADWYRFVAAQEAEVLQTPFAQMDFEYCKDYRESQNARAGGVLVAMLNGVNCLHPELQAVEQDVSKFSFLTQIMDDIADTAEDLTAQRPSYATGALIDNPAELQRMREYIDKHPGAKVTPGQFRQVAPAAYGKIRQAHKSYCKELKDLEGGKAMTNLARGAFFVFPYFRNLMYKINPDFANF